MAFTNQFDTTGGGVPGMGDAFITTPISGIDPIAQIIQNGAQRRQEREKQRQEQLKQQEDIFKGINLGSDKYWVDKDAEYFHGPEGAVPKLLEEVKKAYIAGKGKLNPLDYARFQQSISKLQADAAQSLKDRDVYTKSIESFRNPKSGYDVDKSLELANGFAGAPLGQRDVNNLAGVAKQIDPIQFLNKNYGATIDKDLAPYTKIFDSKEQQEEAQKQIDGTFAAWKPSLISSLVAQGKDLDEATKSVEEYGANIRGKAGYTPKTANQKAYQDATIELKKKTEARQAAHQKVMEQLGWGRLGVSERNATVNEKKLASSTAQPADIRSLVDAAAGGDQNAIDLLNIANEYAGDGEKITKVVSGDGRKLINPATGNEYTADPKQKFIVLESKDGKVRWQPTHNEALQQFTDGIFGQSVNKYIRVDESSGKNVKPFALGTEDQPSVDSKSSSSSSTKNNTTKTKTTTTTENVTTPDEERYILNGKAYKKSALIKQGYDITKLQKYK